MIKKIYTEIATIAKLGNKFLRVYGRGGIQGGRDEHSNPHFTLEIPSENTIVKYMIDPSTGDVSTSIKRTYIKGRKIKKLKDIPSEFDDTVADYLFKKSNYLDENSNKMLNNLQFIGRQWNLENNFEEDNPDYCNYLNWNK